MKNSLILTILCLALSMITSSAQTGVDFEKYFINKTLRVDYYRTGDATTEVTTLDKIYKYGEWAGSIKNLISPFKMGRNRIMIYDRNTNQLIFSKSYDNYFGEYQTSEPAMKGVKRTYFETVLLPCPKHKFMFVLETRDKQNIYHPIFQQEIDPEDYHIINETPYRNDDIIVCLDNGHPHNKVDLLFIGDGYTKNEKEKFEADLKKYSDVLFSFEPFKSNKDKFNVRGIFSPSLESGVDEPRKNIYKNTLLNSTFNSLDSERYLLTEDIEKLYDVAAQAPMDAVVIMCNIDRYGGGGIYNFYASFTASNQRDDYVFVHEFGHSFGGLADEYYTSDVAYSDFYPKGVEPAEVNITALLDPENLKWKDLVSPGVEIPTPWNKEIFDSLSAAPGKLYRERAKKINDLKMAGADESQIQKVTDEYKKIIDKVYKDTELFFINHPMRNKTGAFLGAGYSSEALYRASLNTIMHRFMKEYKGFDEVSAAGIKKIIDFYAE